MSASLTLTGMDDLLRALEELPEELGNEAANVIEAAADETAQGTSANYPMGRTGNLQRGVSVRVKRNRNRVSAKVISGAHHAHLYELGTKVRSYKGANRGAMPEAPAERRLVPRAMRERRKMRDRLIAIVREAGFTVRET